jgi:Zn-dependent membrane protease YugP
MFFPFSTMDFFILIPALLLALYAQYKVKSAFREMSERRSASGLTGAQVARDMLRKNQIFDVEVEETQGTLSDHYDPRSKTLRLSSEVYRSNSLAALGVAAHETGHAVQHATGYAPLQLRHAIFPVANFGSSLGIPLFIGGLFFSSPFLMDFGIILFAAAVAFQVVTLPVEFNASSKALAQLTSGGYLRADEVGGARKVLQAAALTYVAATAVAALHLIRLLLLRDSND